MWNDIDTGAYEGMIAETVSIPKENGETLNVYGHDPIRLCEILQIQVEGRAGKAKGLSLTLENGENVFVKQNSIDIPAETLKYAIEIRKK